MEKKLLLEEALKCSEQERKWKFSLTKCRSEWLKSKKRYVEQTPSFHLYRHPVAAFTNGRPVYLLGFRHSLISKNISAVVYYPNVGYVNMHVYSSKVWNDMIKAVGSSVEIYGVKITIGNKGFELINVD